MGDDSGGQNWLGGLLKLNKNGQFSAFLAVWELFRKFLGRLRSGLYKSCMKL